MAAGKIIGGLLGFFSGGFLGAIVGVLVGHFFDKSLSQSMRFDVGAERQRQQQLFFETSFAIMGHIAKADGRISEAEISQTEILMTRIGLTPEHRQEAIRLFKSGAQPDFQLEPVISRFIDSGGRQHNLPNVLLEFLLVVALADGELHPVERDILQRVALYMGVSARQFEALLAMLLAQQEFGDDNTNRDYQRRSVPPRDAQQILQRAYQALGVSASSSDKEIKQAYRKLMSQHHPDNLIAQGVPEDMIKLATEKSQEIQAAYEVIKKSRGN